MCIIATICHCKRLYRVVFIRGIDQGVSTCLLHGVDYNFVVGKQHVSMENKLFVVEAVW